MSLLRHARSAESSRKAFPRWGGVWKKKCPLGSDISSSFEGNKCGVSETGMDLGLHECNVLGIQLNLATCILQPTASVYIPLSRYSSSPSGTKVFFHPTRRDSPSMAATVADGTVVFPHPGPRTVGLEFPHFSTRTRRFSERCFA